MKTNTKKLLEDISEDCLAELTRYKYNKNLEISDKYRRGKITSYEYILDLIWHFYEKDKKLKLEFEKIISDQIENVSSLNNNDYYKGLTEVLTWTKSKLNEKKSNE